MFRDSLGGTCLNSALKRRYKDLESEASLCYATISQRPFLKGK